MTALIIHLVIHFSSVSEVQIVIHANGLITVNSFQYLLQEGWVYHKFSHRYFKRHPTTFSTVSQLCINWPLLTMRIKILSKRLNLFTPLPLSNLMWQSSWLPHFVPWWLILGDYLPISAISHRHIVSRTTNNLWNTSRGFLLGGSWCWTFRFCHEIHCYIPRSSEKIFCNEKSMKSELF